MTSLQRPDRDSQIVLSGCKEAEACESTTGSLDITCYQDIVSLVWFVLIGLCIWHAPRLLAKWMNNVGKAVEAYRHLRQVWYDENQNSQHRDANIVSFQKDLDDQKVIESNSSLKTQDATSSGK
ncbi:hypothetical protein E2P81_ATG10168 [Venturia nashicola]|nr:hypothetical protein E2P81_ATG10168 [Venturia nashicola]